MFDLADIWARRTGHDVTLVSANDHVHSRRSAHYLGLAIDLHSSANSLLAGALRRLGYTVLWNVPGHFSHVHVESDVRLWRPLARALPAIGTGSRALTSGSGSPPTR
jgi:hypothetical protein